MVTKALQIGGALALLYAARRYYRNWGTTKHEARKPLEGDDLLSDSVVRTTAAVWIDAPAAAVWPRLVQAVRERNADDMVEVIDEQAIVLRTDRPWDAVWSFHLLPYGPDRSRLLTRTRVRLRHPGELLMVEITGPARAFMARSMLLGVKRRAEQQFREKVDVATPMAALN
ncbi:SRPBCC family protein [Mycolicibacterium sp. XJ1819]